MEFLLFVVLTSASVIALLWWGHRQDEKTKLRQEKRLNNLSGK